MKRDCHLFAADLVELAHGEDRQEAASHAADCASCGILLHHYREILGVAQEKWHYPSAGVVANAISIFPAAPRRVAALAGHTFGFAGARRSAAEAFQLRFEDEGVAVRVAYEPTAGGWTLMGRTDAQAVYHLGEAVPVNEGRFQFDVATLEDSEFEIDGPKGTIVIPAATQVIDDEPGRNP